jgi:uncharacterized peroxidase-related enzyme
MSRIPALELSQATGKTKEILDAVHGMLGVTPNLFRVAAQAPSVLEGLVGLNTSTAKGNLRARVREAIALTVAEANRCDYCLSAHTVLGKGAGLSENEMDQARDAASGDPKTTAILRFARAVVAERGRIAQGDLDTLEQAGVTKAEALEIVANVVLNIFTNYVNLVAATDIDFPVVRAAR